MSRPAIERAARIGGSRSHAGTAWRTAVVLALVLASRPGGAAPIEPPPHRPPAGVVRIWGTAQAQSQVQAWAADFAGLHPSLRIDTHLTGSDVGMAGLYTGQADIVLIGREATDSEIKAFEWVFRYRPTRIEVMTGSLATPGQSPALGVFVHRDNPLARLTFAQLDAVFGGEPRRAVPAIRTWGQLGLRGAWAQRPIRLYAPAAESGSGRFFRQVALGASTKMHWDALTEFAEPVHRAGSADSAGRRILAALATDRDGIAIADLGTVPAAVKPLALATAAGGPYRRVTPAHLITGRYPLGRRVYAYVNRPPGAPLDAGVATFLRHVLGPSGQRRIGAANGYLPLAASRIPTQLQSLE